MYIAIGSFEEVEGFSMLGWDLDYDSLKKRLESDKSLETYDFIDVYKCFPGGKIEFDYSIKE